MEAGRSKVKMRAGLVSFEASLLGLQTAAFPTDCLPSLLVDVLIFSYCVYSKLLSHIRLFGTPWTVTHQSPLSMGFSRQEHWSGLPFPSPGDLPNAGIKQGSPALQVDSLPSEPPEKPLISYTPMQNKKLKKCLISELAESCCQSKTSPLCSPLCITKAPLSLVFIMLHIDRLAG